MCAPAAPWTTGASGPSRTARCGLRSADSSGMNGRPAPSGRLACGPSSATRAGGSTTTRSTARRSTSRMAGRGPSGRPGSAAASRGRISRFRRESLQEVLYRQYLQWIAHEQWGDARQRSAGLRVAGRLSVRRCRRKRRRVGEPGPLLVRRVGGRAPGCVQRERPELAIARLSLGRDARARLRVVRRPRETGLGPVRPVPRGSRRRTLQVVGLPARRPGGSLRTRGRGGAGCAG